MRRLCSLKFLSSDVCLVDLLVLLVQVCTFSVVPRASICLSSSLSRVYYFIRYLSVLFFYYYTAKCAIDIEDRVILLGVCGELSAN